MWCEADASTWSVCGTLEGDVDEGTVLGGGRWAPARRRKGKRRADPVPTLPLALGAGDGADTEAAGDTGAVDVAEVFKVVAGTTVSSLLEPTVPLAGAVDGGVPDADAGGCACCWGCCCCCCCCCCCWCSLAASRDKTFERPDFEDEEPVPLSVTEPPTPSLPKVATACCAELPAEAVPATVESAGAVTVAPAALFVPVTVPPPPTGVPSTSASAPAPAPGLDEGKIEPADLRLRFRSSRSRAEIGPGPLRPGVAASAAPSTDPPLPAAPGAPPATASSAEVDDVARSSGSGGITLAGLEDVPTDPVSNDDLLEDVTDVTPPAACEVGERFTAANSPCKDVTEVTTEGSLALRNDLGVCGKASGCWGGNDRRYSSR